MTRQKSAAMASWGRMAWLPAQASARTTFFGQGARRWAPAAASRIRSSRSSGGSSIGRTPTSRVARRPAHTDAQRLQPSTWRLSAAWVSSSSSS